MGHKVRKRKRNGRESVNYYLRYQYEGMPRPKWLNLNTANKEVAEKKAMDFRIEHEKEVAGIIAPKKLRDGASKPLREHMVDYLEDLRARGKAGRNGKDLRLVRSRLELLFDECNWNLPKDVSSDSFSLWRARQDPATKSPKTLNHYQSMPICFSIGCGVWDAFR
jgi:hypothetical protein